MIGQPPRLAQAEGIFHITFGIFHFSFGISRVFYGICLASLVNEPEETVQCFLSMTNEKCQMTYGK